MVGYTGEGYMTIQFSEEKYWKQLNWYDGLLYLSFLEIDGHNDWRLPTEDESPNIPGIPWHQEDGLTCPAERLIIKDYYYVIPVRDI
jgi:hypothetical protein